jgi:hypothetical protein
METTNLDLDSLLDELKTPKQEFEQPEPDPETEPEAIKETSSIEKVEKAKKQAYAIVGRVLFHIIDAPLTMVASIIAQESIGKLRIDKESKEYLIEAYTAVAEAYQWESIPPWVMLVAVGGSAYGSLLYNAFDIRRKKKEEKEKKEMQQNNTAKSVKPKLKVVKKVANETKKSQINNNTGDQRDGEKHPGGKTIKDSQKGTDSNT